MRETCLQMVYELARQDPRVLFVGSDLGVGVLREFKQNYPERFFMEGVSEANIIGMSAGLAMEGRIVYVNTIATFLTRRCYEQVAVDLCLHNVNVRLIAPCRILTIRQNPRHESAFGQAKISAFRTRAFQGPTDV